ncbi:GNAT family N-acetyltransferase [Undibacterium sp. Jales W-56]|uniref:GNAT family N-acetyltransferase n=1 Tax=Undibacterium sp. Jales W-56 TaxID=2897325 RepID=UPI0021CE1525|nr:GNAT family N-acetyltransferase [Undibacterium sp. Jales W-56]MCU6435131.1 GNAT family N-acetyltransferase [Undibacterium sp. Jales W-56]
MHISTDQSRLNIPLIHDFLSQHTAWAKDIPLATVERSIAHSLCFGGYLGDQQIAFARVVSDYATYAYLMDVFVLPEQRGQGFSKQLVSAVVAHPELQGLRRFMLASSDARGLYEKFGFKAPAKPQTLMEINRPGIYQKTG